MSARIAVMTSAVDGWSLSRFARELVALSVTGIEPTVGPDGALLQDDVPAAMRARDLLEASGLRVCCAAATYTTPLGHPALRGTIEVAVALRAPALRVFAAAYRPDRALEGQLEDACTDLRELHAEAAGELVVLIEPARGTVVAAHARAGELARRSSTGVVFDPGSLVGEPERPPALALAELDGLVRHVHVKNRDAAGCGGAAQARELGDGRVDWPEALRCLARSGYSGWLSIDHLSASPSTAVLRRDVAALRRLIAVSADHSNGGAHDG